jgi:predicted lipoprotein with Yx(FWY)xxD motif
MKRPFTFGIAILIAVATEVMAQGVPNLKVEQGCLQVSSGPDKLTTFDQCMAEENSARDRLAKNWETFVASDRRVCLAETTSDGTPSYVELLECLIMARDARGQMGRGRPP